MKREITGVIIRIMACIILLMAIIYMHKKYEDKISDRAAQNGDKMILFVCNEQSDTINAVAYKTRGVLDEDPFSEIIFYGPDRTIVKQYKFPNGFKNMEISITEIK